MTRRFDEFLSVPASSVAPEATPCLPGFVACTMGHAPVPVQNMWQAIYQAAFAQAVMKAMEDNQPTRYQRLMYHVSQN